MRPEGKPGAGWPRTVWLVMALVASHDAAPRMVAAATITVDGTVCTLVDAVTAANTDSASGGCPAGSGADLIELTVDVALEVAAEPSVQGSPTGLPLVAGDLTLEGMGHEIARKATAPKFRIVAVDAGSTLTVLNVILANGHSTFGGGGAISNFGTVELIGSAVLGNASDASGAGISNLGDLTLTDSTISGNSAAREGGGIFSDSGTLVLTGSTISGNSAVLDGGGLFVDSGTASLTASTVSGNSAGRDGGGIFNAFAAVDLTNATLSGNSAPSAGGGIYTTFPSVASTTLTNSIVANSTGDNCFGAIVDGGSNLSDETTCGTVPATLTGLESSLADNGGPTMTHALAIGSSAIGAATAPGCPASDQRGAARVDVCDVGAFEYIPCPDLVLSGETVEETEIRENCQMIVTGPAFAVSASGDLTLRAGKRVKLRSGTSIAAGGRLRIEIDPELQLSPP